MDTPASPAPRRPVLRWLGGKWRLAPWIISKFPEHRIYVEPFGGAASVLLRKPPSYAEVYNDLDDGLVNLFRVLRDPHSADALVKALKLTPFSRTEFFKAYEISDDPIEEARRLVIRSFMGFGSTGFNRASTTGFRSGSKRSGTTPSHDWAGYPECLKLVIARFASVVIENRDATEIMAQQDSDETLHYVDPPYVHATRSDKLRASGGRYHVYNHELNDTQHRELLAFLTTLKGIVVLSGYAHDIYDSALIGWQRVERDALADGARKRTEVLWINRHANGVFA